MYECAVICKYNRTRRHNVKNCTYSCLPINIARELKGRVRDMCVRERGERASERKLNAIIECTQIRVRAIGDMQIVNRDLPRRKSSAFEIFTRLSQPIARCSCDVLCSARIFFGASDSTIDKKNVNVVHWVTSSEWNFFAFDSVFDSESFEWFNHYRIFWSAKDTEFSAITTCNFATCNSKEKWFINANFRFVVYLRWFITAQLFLSRTSDSFISFDE